MEFNIPELGENINSGTVVSVKVKVGDIVQKDDVLFELETEKAVLEVPAPESSKIVKVLIENGQDVEVGEHILDFEPQEEILKEHNEIIEKTILPKTEVNTNLSKTDAKILPAASPSVRREARNLQVDLEKTEGSGSHGRILSEDLEKTKEGGIRRVPMSKLRKTIARNIEHSYFNIPQVTQNDEADITSMEEFRKNSSTSSFKISPSAMILKVLSKALRKFPEFNASIDMEKGEILYKEDINIGVAADTKDGLLVPVIFHADQKSLSEIASELIEKSEKARSRKLTIDEMKGSSFTFTNLGSIGGSFFTPIIPSGEVAILGVGRSSIKPKYIDQAFLPKLFLPLSLSYDHRLIDGAQAVRFLRWIVNSLENPWYMEVDS
ncbi:MAG: dihydrolipoamide acetyltransferase family protein [Leptospirales bacterium]